MFPAEWPDGDPSKPGVGWELAEVILAALVAAFILLNLIWLIR